MKELVKRVKNKEEGAFTELLQKFRPMIYSFFKNYHLEGGDYSISREDLYQEGCLALLEAVESYNEKKGAQFSTFAYIVIRRRIHHHLRKEFRKLKSEYYSLDALDEIDHYKSLASPSPTSTEENYRQQKIMLQIRDYIRTLDEEDRDIVAYRSQKKSYVEIAEILGINPKKVDNRLQKMKHDFRRRYPHES